MQWTVWNDYEPQFLMLCTGLPQDVVYNIILAYLCPRYEVDKHPSLPYKDFLCKEIAMILYCVAESDSFYDFKPSYVRPCILGHYGYMDPSPNIFPEKNKGQAEIFWNETEECWDAEDDWRLPSDEEKDPVWWQGPSSQTWSRAFSHGYTPARSSTQHKNMSRKKLKDLR